MNGIDARDGYTAIKDLHVRSAVIIIAEGISVADERMACYYEGATEAVAHMADAEIDDIALLVADCFISRGLGGDMPAYFERYRAEAAENRANREFDKRAGSQREIAAWASRTRAA